MKYLLTLLAAGLAGGLVLTTPVAAAEYAESGTVSEVSLKGGYVIVDDGKYALSTDVRIYSQSGKDVPASALQRGMKIAFNTVTQGRGRGTITEIAIKPKSQ